MANDSTQTAPTAPTSDVFADAFAESQAGRPASADAKGPDVFANAFNDSIAGRPPMAGAASGSQTPDFSLGAAVAGPTTAVGAPMSPEMQGESSGVSDILHGNIRQGAGKIWDAEKPHVIQGSLLEKAMQKLDPHFQGSVTSDQVSAHAAAEAINQPVADVAQFIDKDAHPVEKAIAETVQSFLTPTTVATLYATGGLGLVKSPAALGLASRLISGGYSVAAIASAYKNIEGFKDAYDKGDSSEAAYQLTHAITSGLLAAVSGYYGATGRFPNPFRAKANAAAAATSKIEPAVAARTAKAGLAPGEAGLTPEAAAAQTTQSAIEAKATTQANVDQALRDIATRHATENALPRPAAGTASRDILTTNGDALVDAGKANYKILDKYTDGQFTNAQNELKNAQQELRTKAGMTDADTGDLEANVTRAQWNVDHLFDKAVAAGMPKETADLARTQFRTGQATLDAANDVRLVNKVTGAGTRTTNLNTLENRWTARYDSGRLQQAFGEQGAKDALVQVHAARETADIFKAMPPTESQALQQLITDNTVTGGKLGPTTNWRGVRTAFSKLPDRAARFSDVPKVENFINRQNLYQIYRTGAKVAGVAVVAHGLGIDKFILHLMLGE